MLDLERLRTGLVDDFRILHEQREHRLEIDKALLDVAVDHAHEIEGHVELDQDGVDHDEIADRSLASHHALGGKQEAHRHADREDQRLARVEHGQRIIGLDRGRLVAGHGNIEPTRLHALIAEILDGLEVKEAVDRPGIGLRIAVVHLAADVDPPLAGGEREPEIERDRDGYHQHIHPREVVNEDAGDQHQLERRR